MTGATTNQRRRRVWFCSTSGAVHYRPVGWRSVVPLYSQESDIHRAWRPVRLASSAQITIRQAAKWPPLRLAWLLPRAAFFVSWLLSCKVLKLCFTASLLLLNSDCTLPPLCSRVLYNKVTEKRVCSCSSPSAGSFLCLHHLICWPSLGRRNGPHSGLPGVPKSMDTNWTHATLVNTQCTISFCLVYHMWCHWL